MAFKFHPFKGMSPSEVSTVGKELHSLVDEGSLERVARFVIEEAMKGSDIRITAELLLAGDRPYVIQVFDSTRTYDRQRRLSFVVCYESLGRLEKIGLLNVDGFLCAESEDEI